MFGDSAQHGCVDLCHGHCINSLPCICFLLFVASCHIVSLILQSTLGDAAKQDGHQGVLAIAKKAQDLYKEQQEIQRKADQRCVGTINSLEYTKVKRLSAVLGGAPLLGCIAPRAYLHNIGCGWMTRIQVLTVCRLSCVHRACMSYVATTSARFCVKHNFVW